MPDDATVSYGHQVRRELMGELAADRMSESEYAGPIMQKFVDLAAETIWAKIWTRPGLDLKTRTLVCVISDAATGRTSTLGLHLQMALRQGWTEDELTEALLHLVGYIGVPLVREALLCATETFSPAENPVA